MRKIKNLRIFNLIEKLLNRLNLREKIIYLFIFCVIIPLICTDAIILSRIIASERIETHREAESIGESVYNMLYEIIASCERIAISVNFNENIGELLGGNYENGYDYYDKYYEITENFFFQTLVGFDNTKVKLYSSNPTIINGGYVGKIQQVENESWYQAFKNSGKDKFFYCWYDETKNSIESNRSIYFVERLTYHNNDYENFIRINIDYSTFVRRLENLGYGNPVYVCDGNKVLFSNIGMNNLKDEFESINFSKDELYTRPCELMGNIDRVVVLRKENSITEYLKRNIGTIFILLFINVALPGIVMIELDYSIIHRIKKLDQVFGKRENDQLIKIDNPDGSDEIGNLMVNYNMMADYINQLIQIVYKDRLHEQEVNLARKNAELLALHSQINPHFMFNALESIRMHSLIKGEKETAEMVEKLALMERQYVDWDSDMIEISQEMNSVAAYLGLQKYRFGDKLQYELSIDEAVKNKLIPKLTIVTFVENACVHGMENKNSECWVFVRVYKKDDNIVLEIEDTGNGMSDEMVANLKEKSKSIDIDDLKSMHHVGIFNALLRLKMTTNEEFSFDIESEEGIGTMIQITIPDNIITEDMHA